ncbi:hypothetical protein N7532_009281 [Penicillium argentinense]|uniref:Uncharacterized protein n=1 Tax=Penicillium argentinense TaxID=1131581 RepID=A0A9W9EZ24_9EURO|nr:uncharacterized protein N7532_009281 [Penicillium argentinense]KAJ5090597.1 hypothetical protein N7532_009281 [Penicillium argentinense]
MTKLFTATRQLNEKNAPKRAADTEVVLIEVHDRLPGSEMHLRGIARMNYLHARYRRAGKILDEDMLHTLGSAVVDIFHAVDTGEWRSLTNVERCAVGVFHKALGEAMEIPFTALPSFKNGWRDGGHFAEELCDWVKWYEGVAVKPAESNRVIGRQLMDLAVWNLPGFLRPLVRRVIATKLERHVRVSMGFTEPGAVVEGGPSRAVRVLDDKPDPKTGLYTIDLWIAHPWYVPSTFKNRWGLKAIFARLFGDGGVPGDGYGASGYDLRTIGPTAQEKRGLEETEAIYTELAQRDYAGGCPFHRPSATDS